MIEIFYVTEFSAIRISWDLKEFYSGLLRPRREVDYSRLPSRSGSLLPLRLRSQDDLICRFNQVLGLEFLLA